jgi:hypothetical protein
VTDYLLNAYQDWACPNCGLTERTVAQPPNSARMHTCPRLHNLTAPMVIAGTDCQVIAVERADYLNGAIQRTGDDGKPYMAVETRRPDGSNDLVVFAECAVTGAAGVDA